jgi:hypothetical protein
MAFQLAFAFACITLGWVGRVMFDNAERSLRRRYALARLYYYTRKGRVNFRPPSDES